MVMEKSPLCLDALLDMGEGPWMRVVFLAPPGPGPGPVPFRPVFCGANPSAHVIDNVSCIILVRSRAFLSSIYNTMYMFSDTIAVY